MYKMFAVATALALLGGLGAGAHAQNGQAPQVETSIAEDVASSFAVLRGAVVANAVPASVWMEHGPTSALGKRTNVPAPQDSFTRYEVRVSLQGIPAGAPYYYRVVAENQFGRREGATLYFDVPGVPVGVTQGAVGASASEPVNAFASENGSVLSTKCVVLLPNLSNSRFTPGSQMNYSFVYRNECGNELSDATVKLTLPSSVEFVGTDYSRFVRDGRTLIYALGSVAPHFQSAIMIEANIAEDAKDGEQIIFEGAFSFKDDAGQVHSAGARTEELVRAPSPVLAAITLPALSSTFGKPWVWLFVFFIISSAVYYWFFMRRRSARALRSRALIPFVETSPK